MPSPELLAWRQARKNLRAFRKANPKLKGKYLSLRRSLGYLDEHQALVRTSDQFDNAYLVQAVDRMWALLQVYKQAYARLRELEQAENKAWIDWFFSPGAPPPFRTKGETSWFSSPSYSLR